MMSDLYKISFIVFAFTFSLAAALAGESATPRKGLLPTEGSYSYSRQEEIMSALEEAKRSLPKIEIELFRKFKDSKGCNDLWKSPRELKVPMKKGRDCTSLMSTDEFKLENDNFSKLCKAACIANTSTLKTPNGPKSAQNEAEKRATEDALKTCLKSSCEQACDMEAVRANERIDGYRKGMLEGFRWSESIAQ